jgi:hypothetical protein
MRTLVLGFLLLVASTCGAATLPCGPASSFEGTYRTVATPGYHPNTLKLINRGAAWHMNLSSYWAPAPNDDGQRGTVGNFEGEAVAIWPWRCVALFELVEKSEDEPINVTCILLLIFEGRKQVNIETRGQCDFFHGHLATPVGTYIKVDGT